ncbi:unnamed protein product, partial [Candidula unifasciata]
YHSTCSVSPSQQCIPQPAVYPTASSVSPSQQCIPQPAVYPPASSVSLNLQCIPQPIVYPPASSLSLNQQCIPQPAVLIRYIGELLLRKITTMGDNSNQTSKASSLNSEDSFGSAVPVLVSDEDTELILLVISCIIRGTVTIFGIIFNIINAMVFTKLGLQETSNVLFLAIAVADLGALLTLLLGSVCQNPPMFEVFQNVDMAEILFLASAWPHYYFTLVSAILTCQITIERYLCIAFPLAVRRLIRTSRAVISIVAVYTTTLSFVLPVFTSIQLGLEFSLTKNSTIFGLILSPDMVSTIQMTNLFNNVIHITAFFIVSLTTTLTVHKLVAMSKWRNANALSVNSISSRDKKISRMVISNAISFIVCLIPVSA